MKNSTFVLIILISVCLSVPAYAQDLPETEVYATDAPGPVENIDPYLEEELREAAQSGNNGQGLSDEELQNLQLEIDGAALNEPRLADGVAGRGTMDAPDKYWAMNGYPANISFAYEAGGEMLEDGTSIAYWEIGVINAGDASKQEIINLLSPSCRITFRDCAWSYSQREAAFNEISADRGDIVRNVVMSLNAETVVVEIADGYEKDYARKYIEQYGAFVVVTNEIPLAADGAGAVYLQGLDDLGEFPATEEEYAGLGLESGLDTPLIASQMPLYEVKWIPLAILILLCGTVVTLYFNRSRSITAMQTDSGNIVTASAPVSRKQTIAAIKKSALTPPDDMFRSIMERVEKAQP